MPVPLYSTDAIGRELVADSDLDLLSHPGTIPVPPAVPKAPLKPHGGPVTPVAEKTKYGAEDMEKDKNIQATKLGDLKPGDLELEGLQGGIAPTYDPGLLQDLNLYDGFEDFAPPAAIGDFDLLERLDPVKTRKSLAPAPQSDAQKQKLEEAKQDLAGYERSLLPSPKVGKKEEALNKQFGGAPLINTIHKAIMEGQPLDKVLTLLHELQASPRRWSEKEQEQGYVDNIVTDEMVKSYFRDETGFTQLQAQSAKFAKEVEEGRNERAFKQASTKGILPQSMVAPMAARKQAEALIKEYQNKPDDTNLKRRVQDSFNNLSPSQQKDLVTWNQRPNQIPRDPKRRKAHAELFGYGAKIKDGKPGGILGNRFKVQADIKRPGLVADGATLEAASASVHKQLDYAEALHAKGQMSDEEYRRFQDIGELPPEDAAGVKAQQEQLNAALQFQGMTMIKKREFLKNIIANKKAAAFKKGHDLTDQQALAQYLIEAERKFGDRFEGKEVLDFMEGNAAFENIALRLEGEDITKDVEKDNKIFVVKGGHPTGDDFYIGAKNMKEATALAEKEKNKELALYKDYKEKGKTDWAKSALQRARKFEVVAQIPREEAGLEQEGKQDDGLFVDAGSLTRTETVVTGKTKGDIDPLLKFASQDVDELAMKMDPGTMLGMIDDPKGSFERPRGSTPAELEAHRERKEEEARVSARRVLDVVAGGPEAFEEKFNKATPDQRQKILEEMEAADALKFVPEKFRNNTDERAALINRPKGTLSNKEYAALQGTRAKEDPRAYQLRFMGASVEQRRAMINRLEESGAVPPGLQPYTTEAAINTGVVSNFPIPQEPKAREAFFNKVRELKSQGLISNQQMIDLAMADDLFGAISGTRGTRTPAQKKKVKHDSSVGGYISRNRRFKGSKTHKIKTHKWAEGSIPNFAATLDSYDIEKLGAESLGYKAGNIKSIPNFVYNDAEKLIDPDYLNVQSAQIRGLGKPMSNPEGRAVVSPAIVPPKPSAAFDEYLPALARQLNVSKQEAQEVVLKAPRNKSFAFGGALPSVQKVPNFAPLDEKPEGLGAGPNAQFELLGAGVVAKAMDTFAATVPQLGGMIDKLGSIFSEGFQTNFDGNLTIQGLSQEFESLKADILAQVQKYVDGKEKQPSGTNTYGNPGGLPQTAPRGIFNNGSETA